MFTIRCTGENQIMCVCVYVNITRIFIYIGLFGFLPNVKLGGGRKCDKVFL